MAFYDDSTPTGKKECECEHIAHFDQQVDSEKHPYGAEGSNVHEVGTDYGKLNLCETCREECL